MRWSKIVFLSYLLFIIWGCDDIESPGDGYWNVYGGKISDIGKIYVDKVSVAESLNVARIYLSLSEGRANRFTTWRVLDPDDPATEDLVDPNGEDWYDNGYMGYGENYLPVDLPTLHATKSDAYDGEWGERDFLTDENGDVEIFMRVYPDNSDYQGYHPGDNFIITCVVGDTGYLSDTTYPLTSWKKMRIEYDYMEGCTLSIVGFTTIERAFKGENVLYGGNRDYNHCTYLEFKDDSTHLFRSDTNINRYAFDFTNLKLEINEFFASYRSDSIQYPFYHVGACSLDNTPDTLDIHGQCRYRISLDSLTYTPYISTVYIRKIINDFDGELTAWQLKAAIGLVSSHELGHFAAQLTDAYLEPGDHINPVYCIMTSSDKIAENMRYGNNMYFCPACIRMFRGNMYVRGPQVF